MIEGLKPYAEYKDTGQAWLGAVPQHWSVLPHRAVFAEVKDRDHPAEPMLSVTITRGIIQQEALLADSSKKDSSRQDKSAYKLVQPRDLAYNKMRAWQGAIGVSDFRGIISPAYVVMRLREENVPRFFHYLCRTPHFAKEAERWSYGITSDMWSLRPEHFKMIYTALPPREEQEAIVRFLDDAGGRVERAIRAKRKLIALLAEQKQAIIHRAVTRGLAPNAPLKPSGIPWLGDIPQHWEVLPLKRIAWFKSGAGFPVHEQGKKGLEIPFLKVSDMTRPGNERWIETSNYTVSRDVAAKLGAYIFPAEAVIFPKVGGAMLTNKRRLLRQPSCIDNNVMAAVVRRGTVEFVFLMLQQLDFGRLSKPGPVPAIGEGEVREIKVALPPAEEQSQLVAFVQKETATVTTAIARTEREIALLREYRTRLIADVVTGKLDVREAARHLPAEAEAPALSPEEEPAEDALDETTDTGQD